MPINFQNLEIIESTLKNYDGSDLLIVTKNQQTQDISDLLSKGYNIFGENRVQEAKSKYEQLRKEYKFNLHLIGPLQTNKVKIALKLFDVIQTIDRFTLVDAISKFIENQTSIKTSKFFIQVNIGNEFQKFGVPKENLIELYEYCLKKKLSISGLMCIPPNTSNPDKYFEEMKNLKNDINPNLSLSMGMSNDYKIALDYNSNIIRIGSLIFI